MSVAMSSGQVLSLLLPEPHRSWSKGLHPITPVATLVGQAILSVTTSSSKPAGSRTSPLGAALGTSLCETELLATAASSGGVSSGGEASVNIL